MYMKNKEKKHVNQSNKDMRKYVISKHGNQDVIKSFQQLCVPKISFYNLCAD